jgi:rhomboid protease GluP
MSDDYKSDLVPCSQCGAPVLPNLAECMFCGQKDPGKAASSTMGKQYVHIKHATRRRLRENRSRHRNGLDLATPLYRWQQQLLNTDTGFVNGIIGLCVLLFLLSYALGTDGLYRLGATGTVPLANNRWWTPLTAIYLHASLLHILFNMLWIYQLGPLVIRLFGRSTFFIIYTFAGVFGAIVSIAAGTQLTVGASGAIFGLLGAVVYIGYREGRHLAQIARQYALFAGLMLLLGLTSPQVDNWGHVGGLLGGVMATVLIMDYPRYRCPRQLLDRVAMVLVALTLGALILSLTVSL